MKKYNTFVGLDVHKNSIYVALADEENKGEVINYGAIDNDLLALDKLIHKLLSKNRKLKFVYEAGCCGYTIYRHLANKGLSCIIVAPSLLPKKSGSRIKNDRRDAQDLARLYRSGDLDPIYLPSSEDEAMRDLSRAREDAKLAQRNAKQLLLSFLLRHGFRYSGRSHWSLAHKRWLSDISFNHPAQQVVFQNYLNYLNDCTKQLQQLTYEIQNLLPKWRLAPLVKAFQAMRGVSLIVAVTTIAELGDIRSRFSKPREIMAYLGLVPSLYSSGEKTRRGGITKTGNSHVRRVLVEAAWAYRFHARVSRVLFDRQIGLTKSVCDISWKAQTRLCQRFRALTSRGKNQKLVVTAIARELSAFLWAISQEVAVVT